MKSYLISIICLTSIICLLVEILPNGKMKKVSCISLSFLLTFTMLMPIKNFHNDFVIMDESYEYNYISEQAYLESIYEQYVKKTLENNNITISKIKIEFDKNNENTIEKIYLKLDKTNNNSEQEYMSTKEKVCKIISSTLNIEKSIVNFYE